MPLGEAAKGSVKCNAGSGVMPGTLGVGLAVLQLTVTLEATRT